MESAQKGARVAVFPECATNGYNKDDIPNYTVQDFLNSEKEIANACAENNIYGIFGTPYFKEGQRYNIP